MFLLKTGLGEEVYDGHYRATELRGVLSNRSGELLCRQSSRRLGMVDVGVNFFGSLWIKWFVLFVLLGFGDKIGVS